MIKIEKGIPFPANGGKGKPTKYPCRDMEVGDSFVVPAEDQKSARSNCQNYGRPLGKTFAVLKQSDGTFRCWRIK